MIRKGRDGQNEQNDLIAVSPDFTRLPSAFSEESGESDAMNPGRSLWFIPGFPVFSVTGKAGKSVGSSQE